MRIQPEETLSPRQIEDRQREAWREAYRYAAARSPFYREHFRRAGLSLRVPPSLERLARIPTIDKAILSEQTDAFLCVPPQRVVDIVTTSGSTGRPLVWRLTDADLDRLGRNECLSFTCAGLTADDTVILAVTLDRCFMAGMAYFLGLRQLGCAVVRVGPATPVMHLDILRRVSATAIVGVPSFLGLLAEKAAEENFGLASLGVRKAVCIGEPVRHEDFSVNRLGQAIETGWNARVFSTYGVTELASSLCECSAGLGGHLHPELLHLEALDDAGRPVPEGQVGELTATTFGVEAMPLIRYRTGDFAALFRGPCPCGRRTLRLGPILGRKSQKLKVRGSTLFPATLKTVLDGVPEVRSYAILARRDSPLSDHIEVRVAFAGDSRKISEVLRERFQGTAKVSPQITPATSEEIEALQLPHGARKRRYFVDLRGEQP
ncbi:MAG: AMP-binding protein [Verrucomicrobiota bacterium]